jgi:hypothetical protein
MNRLNSSAAAIAALLLVVCLKADYSFAQKGGEKSKSDNDRVKLYSDAVEVVEVSDQAEKCAPADGATTITLRVKSELPIDVRLYHLTRRGGWAFADYPNKKKGDEITSYECNAKAKFKVQTRPVGSTKWPNL